MDFIRDMEQGGYAPNNSNAVRRLNEVVRKWEARLAQKDERKSRRLAGLEPEFKKLKN